jgi:hypothetical protein
VKATRLPEGYTDGALSMNPVSPTSVPSGVSCVEPAHSEEWFTAGPTTTETISPFCGLGIDTGVLVAGAVPPDLPTRAKPPTATTRKAKVAAADPSRLLTTLRARLRSMPSNIDGPASTGRALD